MQHASYHQTVRIIDIDGTVLVTPPSVPGPEMPMKTDVEPTPGALEQVAQWYDQGDYIVFWTARHEEYREITMRQLDQAGFKYHQIVFNKPYSRDIHIYDDKPMQFHFIERNQGLDISVEDSSSS